MKSPSFLKPAIILLLLISCLAGGYWVWKQKAERYPLPIPGGNRLPVIIWTKDGQLDVGGFKNTENFHIEDYQWGGLFGGTTAQMRLEATFRFHVSLDPKKWRIGLDESKKNILVFSPKLQPTLPVAFDTGSIQIEASGNWIPLDRDKENLLDKLRGSVTQELRIRSWQKESIGQAKVAARNTIAEFIRNWLLRTNYRDYNVRVLFSDEEGYQDFTPQLPEQNKM